MTTYINRKLLQSLENAQCIQKDVKQYETGHSYHGLAQHGLKNGYGQLFDANSSSYQGSYVDSRKSGTGSHFWPSGDYFCGDFHADRRNGWGVYHASTKEIYEGTFFNDQRHGFGMNRWPDGASYFGTFFLDKRCGYGIMTYGDGSVYEGYFADNQPEGPGILRASEADGRTEDIGYWRCGRIVRLLRSLPSGEQLSWKAQFPEYGFYLSVRGEVSEPSSNNQTIPEFIHQASQTERTDLVTPRGMHSGKDRCVFRDGEGNSNQLLFNNLNSILPAHLHISDARSGLFQAVLADHMFHRLLHFKPPASGSSWPSQMMEQVSRRISDMSQLLQSGTEVVSADLCLLDGAAFIKPCMVNEEEEDETQRESHVCGEVLSRNTTNKQENTQKKIDHEFDQMQTANLILIRKRVGQLKSLQKFVRNAHAQWPTIATEKPINGSDVMLESNATVEATAPSVDPMDWSKLWKDRFKAIKRSKHPKNLVNLIGRNESMTMDFLASCQLGEFEKLRQLLVNGLNGEVQSQGRIDLNVADHHGRFGLLWAVLAWNEQLLHLLLDFGANVNQVTDDGLCALSLCLLYYYRATSQLDSSTPIKKPPHILPYAPRCASFGSSTTASCYGLAAHNARPFVYQAEVQMVLQDKSLIDEETQEARARSIQTKRLYTSRSQTIKANRIQSKMTGRTSTNLPSISVPSEPAVIVPSYKRFTNCLTHLTTQLQDSLIGECESSIDSNDAQPRRTVAPSEWVENERNTKQSKKSSRALGKQTPDQEEVSFSKRSLMDYPRRNVSEKALDSAAKELSKNPRFLASRSVSPASLSNRTLETASSRTKTDQMSESTVEHRAVLLAQKKQVVRMINLLLRRGADPNAANQPLPCLFMAVQAGDSDMVELLLRHGANPKTLLRVTDDIASEQGSLNPNTRASFITESITSDENIPIPSLDGLTPLHYAVMLPGASGVRIVQLLLAASADPNSRATEDNSFTVRQKPTSKGRAGSAERIEDSRSYASKATSAMTSLAPISENGENNELLGGRTPLHLACARDYDFEEAAEIVNALMANGADSNLMCNGHTALTLSIASGNDMCVDVLLQYTRTFVNQELTNGLGTSLNVATARTFEFRRDAERRLSLVRKLVETGGAMPHLRFRVGSKHVLGNVIDATYQDYTRDARIAKTPFHALNYVERETYIARTQIMDYLAEQIRKFSKASRPTHDEHGGHVVKKIAGDEVDRLKSPRGKQSSRSGRGSRRSDGCSCTSSASDDSQRKISYSFCYECGRSIGVRLYSCARCGRVLFCSKACKLKSWQSRHRSECHGSSPTIGQYSTVKDDGKKLASVPTERVYKNAPLCSDKIFADGLEIGRYLLCRSANGELLGMWHPANQYRFIINCYLRVNQRGRIFLARYDGQGNYSLI